MASVLFGAIDVHTQTLISNLLCEWTPAPLPLDGIDGYSLPPDGDGPVGLVVLQSMGDEDQIVGWCEAVRRNPVLSGAKLLVALDPDLALQYGPVTSAGADEVMMVPTSIGHLERLLKGLVGAEAVKG